jgi:hypothetical protein
MEHWSNGVMIEEKNLRISMFRIFPILQYSITPTLQSGIVVL